MEIIYYVAASLDGFIATLHGGIEWLKPYEGTGEDYGYGELYRCSSAATHGHQRLQVAPRARGAPAQELGGYPNGIVQLRYETVL